MWRTLALTLASTLTFAAASATAADRTATAAASESPGQSPSAREPAPREASTHGRAESWIDVAPTPYGPILIQQASPPPYRDYQMSRVLSAEERKQWLQTAMPTMARIMKLDAREAMNHFALKYQARPGLSFDEVVQSMLLRANRLNLKYVGRNPMWLDFRAALNDTSAPRIEVFSFCDLAVGRDLLRAVPELAVFLPCRIVVMEDADRNIWIMTLDWDMTWLTVAGENMGMTPELRQGAIEVRNKLDNVMQAAAQGEL